MNSSGSVQKPVALLNTVMNFAIIKAKEVPLHAMETLGGEEV
jgi:hypothetical protein